ncbi:MAG: hypothetical protein R3E68_15420 [Burkholderiaceae bacterium]
MTNSAKPSARSPAASSVARLESTIRRRVIEILDGLPENEPFDWVGGVSIELTTRMLATLFDFPFDERHLLTYWSDLATGHPKDSGPVTSWDMRRRELDKCLARFQALWHERAAAIPATT